jgi:hypothetical protein
MFKFDPKNKKILDDPNRLPFENRNVVLSEAGVRPGDIAASIGCRTGFSTVPRAKRIGKMETYTLSTPLSPLRNKIAFEHYFEDFYPFPPPLSMTPGWSCGGPLNPHQLFNEKGYAKLIFDEEGLSSPRGFGNHSSNSLGNPQLKQG